MDGSEKIALVVDGLNNFRDYELFVSWHGDASHTEKALFSVAGNDIVVNQRTPSAGIAYGDTEVQSLGVYRPTSGAIFATLRPTTQDGLLIAGSLYARPVGNDFGNHLVHLDVRGTTLQSSPTELFLGEFVARDGVLHQNDNPVPTYVGPSAIVVGDGSFDQSLALADLFSDNQSDPLTYSLEVPNDSDLRATLNGSRLDIETNGVNDRIFYISLTATDANGGSTTAAIPVVGGLGLAQGRVTDASGEPVEGVRVHASNAETFATITDANGNYDLLVPLANNTIELVDGQNIASIAAPVSYTEDFDVPFFDTGFDFQFSPAIELTAPASANEGAAVEVQVDLGLSGDLQWDVTGGPVTAESGDETGFSFTPLDSGVYTITATLDADDGTPRSASTVVQVNEVSSFLTVGGNVSTTAGLLDLTRQLVVDPGNDAVTVTVDYGNGDVATFALQRAIANLISKRCIQRRELTP